MRKRICSIFVIIAFFTFVVNVNSSCAKVYKKSKSYNKTIRFYDVAAPGILGTKVSIVDVLTNGTEEYVLSGNSSMTYKKRSVYAHVKPVTACGHLDIRMVTLKHYYQDDTVKKTFTWSKEDYIAPSGCKFIYSKKNESRLDYSRTNKCYARWSLLIAMDGAGHASSTGITGTIYLKHGTTK